MLETISPALNTAELEAFRKRLIALSQACLDVVSFPD
jgi:hypothetical protein